MKQLPTVIVSARISVAEARALMRAAKAQGLKVGAFLKQLILSATNGAKS